MPRAPGLPAAGPALSLAALLVLAGCLAGVAPQAGPGSLDDGFAADWSRLPLQALGDHDHEDPAHHQDLSTPNFELLGYDPLITDYHGRTSGDYLCGEAKSDGDRRLAAVHSWGSDVAFVLVDTTDPAEPRMLGEFVMRNTQVYDLDLSDDLRYLVLGTSPLDSGPDEEKLPASAVAQAASGAPSDTASEVLSSEPALTYRDACTGETEVLPLPADAPYASGVVLIDIADPSDPEVADYHPLTGLGAHSVQLRDVHGDPIAVATVYDSNHQGSYYVFFRIAETPAGAVLERVSTYQYEPTADLGQDRLGAHDAWIQEHPVTGEMLAYLAYGHSGLVIVNIDDPADPALVGQWNDWGHLGVGGDVLGHYAHTARPVDAVWDGRHYTFIGEECITQAADAPSCLIMTLDTTDPANIEYVGFWTLPHMMQWEEQLQFSLHYVDYVDRTLFVSAYHGGLWAVDVSTADALAEMPSIGVFVPAHESPKPVGQTPRSAAADAAVSAYALDNTPIVLDPQANPDGSVTITDVTSGLYTVRFDAADPAPAPVPFRFDGGG